MLVIRRNKRAQCCVLCMAHQGLYVILFISVRLLCLSTSYLRRIGMFNAARLDYQQYTKQGTLLLLRKGKATAIMLCLVLCRTWVCRGVPKRNAFPSVGEVPLFLSYNLNRRNKAAQGHKARVECHCANLKSRIMLPKSLGY